MPEVVLFVGPSAFGLVPSASMLAGITRRPPAARGSVDRLVGEAHEPGVIVLCDGVFHSQPAVSHAELCRALDQGWQVWGVSSLGAIRAHELRFEGMHGFGYVFDLFARHDDFHDDEMCLLHFPEEPYFPLSEALVNLRFALEQKGDALGIPVESRERLLTSLGTLWFGDRTEERIRHTMAEAGIDADAADRLCEWLRHHHIKTIDLAGLLSSRPWCVDQVREGSA